MVIKLRGVIGCRTDLFLRFPNVIQLGLLIMKV
jgi:hypothetical protein